MNKGVQFEAVGKKLFPINPAALAFKHNGAFEGFVLSRAADRLVRLVLDTNNRPTSMPRWPPATPATRCASKSASMALATPATRAPKAW